METDEARVNVALSYAERGWRVLPLWWPLIDDGQPPRCACGNPECDCIGKHPLARPGGAPNGLHSATNDSETVRGWWERWPEANIGIACGPDSGILALDLDGPEGRKSTAGRHLPVTPCVTTGNGTHYYYRHPAIPARNGVRLLPGVDVRADGGYVVAPGSAHLAGVMYEWAVSPDEEQLAEPPDWLLELLHPTRGNGAAQPVADRIPEGKRNDTLTSLAGTMRRRGMGEEPIRAALLVENQGRCDPPLPEVEVEGIARSVVRYAPQTQEVGSGPPPTNEVERLVAEAGRSHDPAPVWEAVPLLARLTRGQYGQTKARLKEILRDRLNRNELDAAVREARQAVYAQPPDEEGRPTIVIGRQLRDMAHEALQALRAANDPPSLFVRSGTLVRIAHDERGRPVIDVVGVDELRGRLTAVANFVRMTREGPRDCNPPEEVVRTVLAEASLPFPALEGIVETPVLRPDGTVLSDPGYDAGTRLFHAPEDELNCPGIPATPTSAEVGEARSLLLETLEDFPFVDEASRANAIGLMLTPIVRPAITGTVPLALIDAPQAGTGKTLLSEVCAQIATGRPAAMLAAPRDDEEWRKRITAVLQTGAALITVDNVERPIDAPSLAMALTAHVWQDRVLGRSEEIALPQRAAWVCTGNNVSLRGDLPRRCYWVRLDARCSRPWQREGFAHPDLLQWVALSRGWLIGALLTLARNWYARRQPEASVPKLGGFDQWTHVIGGILESAGIPGFLGNLGSLYENTDEETAQWEAFLQAWQDYFGDLPVTTAHLVEVITGDKCPALREALPDTVFDRSGEIDRRRLGHALKKKLEVRHGDEGLYIGSPGQRQKVRVWVVKTSTEG